MGAMSVDKFLDDLEDSYDGEFSAAELRDIKKLIFSLEDHERFNLYYFIKSEYTQRGVPRFGVIEKLCNRLMKNESYKSGFHPQAPCQQITKHQNKSAEWIVRECKRIRLKQEREVLLSWEISFIYHWEYLVWLPEKHWDIAKKLIVENKRDESGRNKDLDDLIDKCVKKVPLSKIMIKREARIISLADVMQKIKMKR